MRFHCVYIPHCLYSFTVGGLFACFFVLAVEYNAAVSTRMACPGGSAGKNPPAMWELQVRSWGQEDALEESRQPTPVFLDRGTWWATDTTEATARMHAPKHVHADISDTLIAIILVMYPEVGLLHHMVLIFLIFEVNPELFSIVELSHIPPVPTHTSLSSGSITQQNDTRFTKVESTLTHNHPESTIYPRVQSQCECTLGYVLWVVTWYISTMMLSNVVFLPS